jgi:hypothetical protein
MRLPRANEVRYVWAHRRSVYREPDWHPRPSACKSNKRPSSPLLSACASGHGPPSGKPKRRYLSSPSTYLTFYSPGVRPPATGLYYGNYQLRHASSAQRAGSRHQMGTYFGQRLESPPQYRYLFLRGVNGLPGGSVFFMPSRMSIPAAGRHLYLGSIQHIYISGTTWSDADQPNSPSNTRKQVPSTQRCITGGIPFF